MKKIVSLLCSMAIAATMTSMPAHAEKPQPVDVDPVVYEKLLETTWMCDPNFDGIVTEEELRKAYNIIIDMDGVKDLSWFKYLDNIKYLSITGGDITDYSALKDLPLLKELIMKNVPITDISFAKDMKLESFILSDMPQITLEQRLDAAKFEKDVTVEQGYQKLIGLKPSNILGDGLKCEIKLDDISAARIVNGFDTTSGSAHVVYGAAPGKTKYHIYTPDGIEALSGTITVTESTPYDPPIGEGEVRGERYFSFYDSSNVVLHNNTLYGFNDSGIYICDENIKAFDSGYRIPPNRIYQYFDIAAKTDGTLLLNKKEVPDIKCSDIQHECIITEDGKLYGIYPDGGSLALLEIADDFKEFTYTYKDFYINKDGEVIGYCIDYDEKEKPYVKTFPTGIMNPISMHYNLFVDEDHILWHPWVKYGELGNSKVAENVAEVGMYPVDEFMNEKYLYKSEDGIYHYVSEDKTAEPFPNNPAKFGYLSEGNMYIYQYKDEEQGITGYIKWFITADNTLTLDNNGEHSAITNVASVITPHYDKENNLGYGYFYRTDGSMWRYCFETKEYEEVLPSEPKVTEKTGDVNNDGEFSIADIVLFQKWLLGVQGTEINTNAADICKDNRLNIFDLILMKRTLFKADKSK